MSTTCDNRHLNIQAALEIARGVDADDDIDIFITSYLNQQVRMLWERLMAEPDAYVLDKDEFALFNFFIYRYKDSLVTEAAISRFWNHHQVSYDGA